MALGTLQTIEKPGCPTHCENIRVPYPFGVGTDFSHDLSFNLSCVTSEYKPGKGDIQIHNISDSEISIPTIVSQRYYNQSGFANVIRPSTNLQRYRAFTFSVKNNFTLLGCDEGWTQFLGLCISMKRVLYWVGLPDCHSWIVLGRRILSLLKATLQTTAKPGCPIPYPFGVGTYCSLDLSFNLTRDTSDYEPGKGDIPIHNILDSEISIPAIVSQRY
ncbi:hypothetical protein L1987_37675 [Smallanthus sonchifolius]|uniref:Uncharacterized protein n=1 Tax=Smallanthus sonchifolius TaxID=185202 RepID=A0ACB9HI98_9ASTR|nr:hypothetical protein L1987_37675 [Smallanthus sonchifolius]